MKTRVLLKLALVCLFLVHFSVRAENIYEATERKIQKELAPIKRLDSKFSQEVSTPYEQLLDSYFAKKRHTFSEASHMLLELKRVHEKLVLNKHEILKLPQKNSADLREKVLEYEEKIAKSITILTAAVSENASSKSRGGVKELKWLEVSRNYSVYCNNGYFDVFMRSSQGGYCGGSADGEYLCSQRSSDAANHVCK
jgi:hypothetical protein